MRDLRRKSRTTEETRARGADITILMLSQIECGEGNPTRDAVIGSVRGISMDHLGKLAEKLERN